MKKTIAKKISIKKEFSTDYISRQAGERLRFLILEADTKKQKVEIDFEELIIASTSFFDEAFAKLALENWDSSKINSVIFLKNLNKYDFKVLIDVCKYRGLSFTRS